MTAYARPGLRRVYTALLLALCVGVWAAPGFADGALRGYDAAEGYQYLELGTFPQTLENGLEPIVWRVLYADGDTAFLLSEYVLLHHRIHFDDAAYERSGGDFTQTEMYEYLNGEFLQSFTDGEIRMLKAGEDGSLVTLLTVDDLKNKAYGFTGDRARRGTPTAYALQNGLFQYTNGSSPYWTRTQSETRTYGAVCTKEDGNLGYIRVVVQNEGCRPAVWLNAQMITIEGGDGTLDDPFRISSREGGTE